MITLHDIDLIEGETTCTEREYYQSMQRAINAGVWDMQGSMGRAMMGAINSGHCLLGTKQFRDYYGNPIPSRDQVKEGTKGSIDYVIDAMGEDWAINMSEVK
jgi:uncharacterized cupin superfamily protein